MAKYLKLFETTSQYNTYINGTPDLPNVSLCEDAPTTVHYTSLPTVVDDIAEIRFDFDSPSPITATISKTQNYFTGTANFSFGTGETRPDVGGQFNCWVKTKNNLYDYRDGKGTITAVLKMSNAGPITYGGVELNTNSSFSEEFDDFTSINKTYSLFDAGALDVYDLNELQFDVYFYYEQTEIGKITLRVLP